MIKTKICKSLGAGNKYENFCHECSRKNFKSWKSLINDASYAGTGNSEQRNINKTKQEYPFGTLSVGPGWY